jgi:TnpA family transposase
LHEIGRLERTLFTLDYLRSPTLRHEIQTGLNKGEAGNNLREAVFFHRLGQIRDRAYENQQLRDRAYDNQQHRARGLNLLVAAIVLWNTRYLGAAVAALRGRGHAIGDELLKHVWPLHWEHINLTGDYTWADPEAGEPERLRELRLDRWTGSTELRRAA